MKQFNILLSFNFEYELISESSACSDYIVKRKNFDNTGSQITMNVKLFDNHFSCNCKFFKQYNLPCCDLLHVLRTYPGNQFSSLIYKYSDNWYKIEKLPPSNDVMLQEKDGMNSNINSVGIVSKHTVHATNRLKEVEERCKEIAIISGKYIVT